MNGLFVNPVQSQLEAAEIINLIKSRHPEMQAIIDKLDDSAYQTVRGKVKYTVIAKSLGIDIYSLKFKLKQIRDEFS